MLIISHLCFLSWGQHDSFFEWQRAKIDVGTVSPVIFDLLNEAEAQVKEFTNSSDIIRSLAAQLLSEEDYKLQCSDYFSNISDDGSIVSLKFPYFNLLFLVLYLIILTTQGLANFFSFESNLKLKI